MNLNTKNRKRRNKRVSTVDMQIPNNIKFSGHARAQPRQIVFRSEGSFYWVFLHCWYMFLTDVWFEIILLGRLIVVAHMALTSSRRRRNQSGHETHTIELHEIDLACSRPFVQKKNNESSFFNTIHALFMKYAKFSRIILSLKILKYNKFVIAFDVLQYKFFSQPFVDTLDHFDPYFFFNSLTTGRKDSRMK